MSIEDVLEKIGFNNFVALDLETTGLDNSKDEIIEISAIRFIAGKPSDEFTTLIKPTINIPKKITDLTGINDSLVSGAPSINEKLDDLFSFINNDLVVAHNAQFDLGFLDVYAHKNSKKMKIKGD